MGKRSVALLVIAVFFLAPVIAVTGPAVAQELIWEQLGENGFGEQGTRAFSMVVSGGNLYVGTLNQGGGGQVWRYDGGSDWTQVNADGFGDPGNKMVTSMVDLNGQLIAGTDNKTEGCQVWGATGAPTDEDAVVTPLPVEAEPDSREAGTSAWTWLLYGFLSLIAVMLLLALGYYIVRRSRSGE